MTINIFVIGVMIGAVIFSITPMFSLRERVAFGVSLNCLATAGAILFLYLSRNSLLSRALSRPWLVAMGRMSYFLYLMHMPILMCVATLGIPGSMSPLIAFGLCLLYAWASWRFLESKLIEFGKRVSYQRFPPVTGPVQLHQLTERSHP